MNFTTSRTLSLSLSIWDHNYLIEDIIPFTMISFEFFLLNVIISILFYIILSLLSQQDENSKRLQERLGEIHERLGENTRRTESLLYQIHSIVFDKTEQILCFLEGVVDNNLNDLIGDVVDNTMKVAAARKILCSNILWSMAPCVAPYSDFKVTITSEDTVTTYCVHRYVLGPRSTYFKNLFAFACDCVELATSTSKISLEKNASKAVPSLLDFLYTGQIVIDEENAVALFLLSDYFGIPSLKDEVDAYCFQNPKFSSNPKNS